MNSPDELITGDERSVVQRVFEFAQILQGANAMPLDEDEYWEKPWKWQPEYEKWLSLGQPWPPEDGNPTSLMWEKFVRVVDDI